MNGLLLSTAGSPLARQIGEILSCSQRVYSNYERGDIDIPTAILIKLADFHGVSTDYLLNRTDNPEMAT